MTRAASDVAACYREAARLHRRAYGLRRRGLPGAARDAFVRAALADSARLDWLFYALPFTVRHNWGGDPVEFRQGIDAARAAEETP